MLPFPDFETEEIIHNSFLAPGDKATLYIRADEPLRVCVFRARIPSSVIKLTIKDLEKDDKNL